MSATPNDTQSITTAHTPEKCQDGDKTPKRRVRVRSGMATVHYWRERLFRNSYKDRSGVTVEVPEWYARMRHDGVTKRVRLHHSDKDKAAEEAVYLFNRLQTHGWSVVTAGQAHLPASPTIEEFLGEYEKATASMERPPRTVSVKHYRNCLGMVCRLANVKRIRELTPEAVEKARDAYRAKGRAAKRAETGIQNSVANILRNAAACFSREARAIMARNGLVVENPFANVRCKVDLQPVSPLPQGIVERIWSDAPMLRDGDPAAPDPRKERYRAEYQRKHGRKARWLPIDFRQPHPHAYVALLLALGCGLRANEIDKARWSWLKFDGKGQCYLEVREEDDFTPKGGSRRLIKIPKELYDALVKTRTDLGSPYILGGKATSPEALAAHEYRCRNALRAVNTWLRRHGVETAKHAKPLHRLRKQFGSELATSFGLFAAQKLLGHASPTITAKYYAAHTELPTLTHVKIAG